MGIILFVYGTLKSGGPYHHFLKGQEFAGLAQTLPQYRLFDGGAFPALIKDSFTGKTIQGEVWRIMDALVPLLDELEGAPGLFGRQPIALSGWSEPVQAYFFRGNVAGWKDSGTSWSYREGIEKP